MDRYTRLCTSWSKRAGSQPSGKRPSMDGGRNIIRSHGSGGDSLKKKQTTGAGFRVRFRGLSSLKRREHRAARNGGGRCDRNIGCSRFRCGCGRCFVGRRRTRNCTTSCATTSNEKPRNTSHKGWHGRKRSGGRGEKWGETSKTKKKDAAPPG